jgi:dipeptidase D
MIIKKRKLEIKIPVVREVLQWFEEISKIPRQSRHEEKICKWLLNWSKEHNFITKTDKTGNIVIQVPTTKGYEDAPTVVLQAHVDMVCEKTPGSTHNFLTDPIELIYEDNILRANKTTLGADNGIGVALGLALALDKNIDHPQLELLMTVGEEIGLIGAMHLDETLVKGRILINLDTVDEDTFVIGACGGRSVNITIPLEFEELRENREAYTIKINGLKGGHSGMDIHLQRANAVKELVRVLDFCSDSVDLRIADLKGGSASNAIPRDAEATIFIPGDKAALLQKKIKKIEALIQNDFFNTDLDMLFSLEKNRKTLLSKVTSKKSTQQIINLVLSLPDGVQRVSAKIQGSVETSCNLATITLKNNKLTVITSLRSSLFSRLTALQKQITSIVELIGGQYELSDKYPGWEANLNSSLLKTAKNVYKKLFAEDPVLDVIHGGLECGVIADKFPGMDIISLGPKLRDEHTPDEFIYIDSIEHTYKLLAGILSK